MNIITNILSKLMRVYFNFEYRAYINYVTKMVTSSKDWKRYYEMNMRLFEDGINYSKPSVFDDFLVHELGGIENCFDNLTIHEMWYSTRMFRDKAYRNHTVLNIWEAVATSDFM